MRRVRITGWLPGYPDPEYYLRLLFQSTSRTNEGVSQIRRSTSSSSRRGRSAQTAAGSSASTRPTGTPIAERVAVIPLVYGRSTAFVRPEVEGWWEFGKSSANFADLVVNR